MHEGSDPRPRRPAAWRVGTPVVLLLAGGLFVVSSVNSDGTDLRPGRYTSLASLVRTESERTAALQQRVVDLGDEVEDLTREVGDARVDDLRSEVAGLDPRAQVSRTSGPGVVVTLDDAPDDVLATSSLDRNLLVVHQQDIQAVVNAMWAGGARAVTIQGQRILSTTGIKCVGSNVQLGGVFYPPPYVVAAVGDPDDLVDALAADPVVTRYREYAAASDVLVGWDLEYDDDVVAPAHERPLDLTHAQPLPEG